MKLDLARLPILEMVVGFLLLVLAAAFIGAFSATSGGGESAPPAASGTAGATPTGGAATGGGLTVTEVDTQFKETEFTVKAGSSVTFNIKNEGAATHNMRIAGPDGRYNTEDDAVSNPQAVPGGQTATIAWQAPSQPGSIIFHCDFHPDQMKGTITVQ